MAAKPGVQPTGGVERPIKRMVRSVWLALLLLTGMGALQAQALSVGVLAGAPLTDVVNNSSLGNAGGLFAVPTSTNFTIGPSVRVNLPLHLRVEVDALYRPYGFTLYGNNFQENASAQQWRFPMLLQYRFGPPVIKPFVEGGISIDHLGNLSDSVGGQLLQSSLADVHRSDAGVVLGAGIDANLLLLHVSGEIRYTRQTLSNFANISNLNQAEVLFGVRF
jgi:hypothetical protein